MSGADPRIAAWLAEQVGVEANALGAYTLARAVLERMRATEHEGRLGSHASVASTDVDDVAQTGHAPPPGPALAAARADAYWYLLSTSTDEQQALIERLVVPETWFFRDRQAFAGLAKLADEQLVREPSNTLRILSLPCSTGEEPYSISMALLDAGIGPGRFSIDAFDISARAIAFAERAMYGRNSFRGDALEFRDRHFEAHGHEWLLSEPVRRQVRFARANLFAPWPGGQAPYHFVFCRNLFIYFDEPARERALALIDARLAAGGTLFVGPAEAGWVARHAMVTAGLPLAFAFRRSPVGSAATAALPTGRLSATPRAHPGAHPAAASARSTPAMDAPAALSRLRASPASTEPGRHAPTRRSPEAALAHAQRLADAGHLDEAERLAHACVLEHGPAPDAFYLLGLIAGARGRDADARDFYRKALYLEPEHIEALTHLATLLEAAGDRHAAQHLIARADRAQAKGNEERHG
jgi:chemotaxis protein methyltransferase WspC